MTEEQKTARRQALRQCEQILGAYLTDYLTDDGDEGFEDVDPEVDDLRNQLIELEENT